MVCVREHAVRITLRAAVPARYRLRWLTRAGFWCAMPERPRLGAGAMSLIYGTAIKTLRKPRKISELQISNRR
jgi:hypothetical protein